MPSEDRKKITETSFNPPFLQLQSNSDKKKKFLLPIISTLDTNKGTEHNFERRSL